MVTRLYPGLLGLSKRAHKNNPAWLQEQPRIPSPNTHRTARKVQTSATREFARACQSSLLCRPYYTWVRTESQKKRRREVTTAY